MSEDAPHSAHHCMYCDSADTELFSLFGNTLLGSQYRCKCCHAIFEVVRFDDDEAGQQSETPNDI